MIIIQVNVALIHVTDAAIKTCEIVCNQNIELCDDDNDFNDINEKYVDSDSCNLLDVLAALMKMWDKLQSNTKNKNKKITQKWIEKKKWYSVFKILCWEKYFNASQQKNFAQQNSTCDQIVKNSFMLIQTEAEDDAESLNDIMMTDKSIRHASVSKEKKLVKELKNWVKKSFKKLLMLLIR